jgi:hypothetical protein
MMKSESYNLGFSAGRAWAKISRARIELLKYYDHLPEDFTDREGYEEIASLLLDAMMFLCDDEE